MIIAYKDPVENQHMKKILDKALTGFFVVVLGILWYCSSKYHVKPKQYKIAIYDVFGNQIKIDGDKDQFQHIQGCKQLHFRISKTDFHITIFRWQQKFQKSKGKDCSRIFKKAQR